jgi:hypothetical protein
MGNFAHAGAESFFADQYFSSLRVGGRHMEDHYLLMQVSSAGFEIAKTRAGLAVAFRVIMFPSAAGPYLKTDLRLKFFRRYMIVFIRYKFWSKKYE